MSQTIPLPPVTLVLGGARSGKSSYAETLVEQSGLDPVYLATAEPGDAEMAARIARHRARRGPHWQTVEEPVGLLPALRQHTAANRAVLVDCLTLWLSNLMGGGYAVETESGALVGGLTGLPGPVVFVSNEVGQGIVPADAVAREFRDHAGRLNQAIAAAAERVVMVIAGLPLVLKPAAAGGGA